VAVAVGQLHNLGTCPFESVNTRTQTREPAQRRRAE
jgi:hypothetical protein